MKHFHTLLSVLSLSLAFMACDSISEDERFVPVEKKYVDTTSTDTTTVPHVVLVEDYTGQMCTNCPTAARMLANVRARVGEENVVVVGIYSGPFGHNQAGRNLPLTTDVGNDYYNSWDFNNLQPIGLVDRTGVLEYTSWPVRIEERLQLRTPVSIDVQESTYDAATDELRMRAAVKTLDGSAINAKQMVWIVEDSIVSTQYDLDENKNPITVRDYVHNHVFRTVLSNQWGDDVALSGQEQTFTYTCKLQSTGWNAEHLAAVVFIYDSNGVMQTVKERIINKQP